jgi:hypothetical protein
VLADKRIVKKDLGEKTVLIARLARKELESLIQFVRPNPHAPQVTWPTDLPNGTYWRHLADLLYQMGSIDSWPDSKVLRAWLEREIVPALTWATSKAKDPAWLLADPRPKSAPAPVLVEAAPAAAPLVEKAEAELGGNNVADFDEVEVGDLARAERLEAAVKRLGPAVASLGGMVTLATPGQVSAKRSEVTPPPMMVEDAEAPQGGLRRPAFIDKSRELAMADLPSLEDALREPGARMR